MIDPDSEQFLAHVRLACMPGIGSRLRKMLLQKFGGPQGVFAASPAELRQVGRMGKQLTDLIAQEAGIPAARAVVAQCQRDAIGILLEGDEGYPGLLARIPDPPHLLFVRGSLLPCDALAVAVVGARHATAYGLRVAEQLGEGLSRAGYTVVSGLARGIDAAAHKGALAAGGRTIAVLGSGVLNIYPPEHDHLAAQIAAHGAVLSEAPPLLPPFPGAFPQRNRIVAGLSLGTVVVQASDRSGALITARLALEQGREVFAVPGPIDCRLSQGCHDLIRDGATLVGRVDDILEELGPLFETAVSSAGRSVQHPAELKLDETERRVLDGVGPAGSSTPTNIDDVVAACGLETSRVLATLSVLEMRRLVRRVPGNRVQRT
ncbi:MAG: DNA-processing protein DprA [Planctomycetota bacterium]